jgi:beta-lactamase superfamily II metal-dependent hydrolase
LPEHVLFDLHVLDLEYGQAALLDLGEAEVLVDAGNGPDVATYFDACNCIDGDIELAVISHAHIDHYGGFVRLIKSGYRFAEVWEPGYAPRAVGEYSKFLAALNAAPMVRRPIRAWYPPATESGRIEWSASESIPGARFSILHSRVPPSSESDADDQEGERPRGTMGRRDVNVNNTSIVLLVEVEGVRILFPGDAEARPSRDRPPAPPEPELIDLATRVPGALKADILMAPHHGSGSASTQPFIDAVDPRIVLFSAHTRFMRAMPDKQVLARYASPRRQLLSTDRDRAACMDHILVRAYDTGFIGFQQRRSVDGEVRWHGRLASGSEVTHETLLECLRRNEERLSGRQGPAAGAEDAWGEMTADPNTPAQCPTDRLDVVDALRGADLTGVVLPGGTFSGMNLDGAILRGALLRDAYLSGASLIGADLSLADLRGATLAAANMSNSKMIGSWPPLDLRRVVLTGADLTWSHLARSDMSGANLEDVTLAHADMRDFIMLGGEFRPLTLRSADLRNGLLEPSPDLDARRLVPDLVLADYLPTLRFEQSPHALVALREELRKAGVRRRERELTYAIEHGSRLKSGGVESAFGWLLFEAPCRYGMTVARPLKALAWSWAIFAILYYACMRFGRRSGLMLVAVRRRRSDAGKTRTCVRRIRWRHASARSRWGTILANLGDEARLLWISFVFSLRSAFNLKFRWFEAGTWIRMMHAREFELEPRGKVRVLAGVQSLLSLYLIAIWLLTYFGRPFG